MILYNSLTAGPRGSVGQFSLSACPWRHTPSIPGRRPPPPCRVPTPVLADDAMMRWGSRCCWRIGTAAQQRAASNASDGERQWPWRASYAVRVLVMAVRGLPSARQVPCPAALGKKRLAPRAEASLGQLDARLDQPPMQRFYASTAPKVYSWITSAVRRRDGLGCDGRAGQGSVGHGHGGDGGGDGRCRRGVMRECLLHVLGRVD